MCLWMRARMTQELAPVFPNCQCFIAVMILMGLLLLLSLIEPSRGNKSKFCLVKSSLWNYLKVVCNLRNGSTGSRKKFIKEVEVDKMPNKWTLKVDFFFSNAGCQDHFLNALVLKRNIQDHFCGRFSYVWLRTTCTPLGWAKWIRSLHWKLSCSILYLLLFFLF